MSHPERDDKASPKEKSDGVAAPENSPPKEPVKKLTSEEQMALYEKDLKENDWGHQPC